MINWYIGTMGFGWKDWKGTFYPEKISPKEMLAFYSRAFNAVEADTTFYGIPAQATLDRWVQTTRPEFRICPKTPRLITHEKGLVDVELEMQAFTNAMRSLGEKLGVLLVQLPPSFTIDQVEVLTHFLDTLPGDLRYAVEFRHRSWFNETTREILASRNVCWAATEFLNLPKKIYLTSDFLYIRWIGRHHRFPHHKFEQADPSASLRWWHQQIVESISQVHTVYGFFNNDYAGHSPTAAKHFMELIGLPTGEKPDPKQDSLL